MPTSNGEPDEWTSEGSGRSGSRTGKGTVVYDLRITVDHVGGRPVCGLAEGDYFEVTESSRVRIPPGKHFCLYAMQSVMPLLPAKQRQMSAGDWLEQDSLVACPDPQERLVMRIDRTGLRRIRTEDLT